GSRRSTTRGRSARGTISGPSSTPGGWSPGRGGGWTPPVAEPSSGEGRPGLERGLPRPALEGAGERRRVRVAGEEGDLVGRELAVGEIGAGDGPPGLLEQLVEAGRLSLQPPLEGPLAHSHLLRDHALRGLAGPQALGDAPRTVLADGVE